jgi:hypothetical protein
MANRNCESKNRPDETRIVSKKRYEHTRKMEGMVVDWSYRSGGVRNRFMKKY